MFSLLLYSLRRLRSAKVGLPRLRRLINGEGQERGEEDERVGERLSLLKSGADAADRTSTNGTGVDVSLP